MRCLLAIPLCLCCVVSVAAPPKPSGNGSGVDLVRLKNGRTLRGAVWSRTADRALMVVRREWLQRTYADWAREVTDENRAAQVSAWQNTRERIETALSEIADAPRLTFFLKQEAERLQKLVDNPAEDSEFLWLDVEGAQVAQFAPATPQRQRIALWGWSEHLADVETRDVGTLTRELQKGGIKLDAAAPDLSDRLPARPQSDREWSARLAIVAYALQKPLDFQGTADAVFPTTSGQRVDIAAVLPKLLERQLQSVLSDLTGAAPPANQSAERAWLPGAIRTAQDAGVHGFRVTRVDVAAEVHRANVNSEFVVRVAENQWIPVWQTYELANGSQPRPEEEARIAQDPQLKAALDAVKSLGIGAEGNVTAAIRMGAATMAAQQSVDQRFFEFRERYLKRLDGPVLNVPQQ